MKTLGPDDAWRRLCEILAWFRDVQSEGGYRVYCAKPSRGRLQGGGTPGGLGLDHEFLESVLVPQVVLYGYLGLRPTAEGPAMSPRLPADWPSLSVTGIHVHDVTAERSGTVRLVVRQPGKRPLLVRIHNRSITLPARAGETVVEASP